MRTHVTLAISALSPALQAASRHDSSLARHAVTPAARLQPLLCCATAPQHSWPQLCTSPLYALKAFLSVLPMEPPALSMDLAASPSRRLLLALISSMTRARCARSLGQTRK